MYHNLLKGLNINTPCPPLKVVLPKKDIEWAEGTQKRLEIKDTGYILIHGGSSKLAIRKGIDKVYPVAKWQEIINDLQSKQPNLPIVLLEGPEDGQWVSELTSLCPNLKTVSPSDIGKLAAIIGGASLMLCTDSAPMHLSVAVGTYTIALFGPTSVQKLLPQSDQCVGIQSPTGSIADIKPEEVLSQVWRG